MEDVVSLAWEIYLSLLGWSVEEGERKQDSSKERDRWCEIQRKQKGNSRIDGEERRRSEGGKQKGKEKTSQH